MGHGQEEPIAGVTAGIEPHGLFQCRDRGFPITGAIQSLAERPPAIPGLRSCLPRGFLRDFERAKRPVWDGK
jgi:hypothetical protein